MKVFKQNTKYKIEAKNSNHNVELKNLSEIHWPIQKLERERKIDVTNG